MLDVVAHQLEAMLSSGGGASTIAKRWAKNVLRASEVINSSPSYPYHYDALVTVAGYSSGNPSLRGVGLDEGAATLYDSGSALF